MAARKPRRTSAQISRSEPRTTVRRRPAKARPAADARGLGPVELELEQRLGYRFRQVDFLRLALTHRSWVREQARTGATESGDNERLEFLGDAVLGIRVSERLLAAFPASSEGQLSRLRSWIVSARNLATAALPLRLGEALRLSRAEEAIGGRNKSRLLANAMEAVIAAIHLDGGYRSAARFIDRNVLGPGFERMSPTDLHEFAYKSALQEWSHAAGHGTPVYRVLETSGPDHERVFAVRVELDGIVQADASALSKKAAEQKAAAMALMHLGVLPAETPADD